MNFSILRRYWTKTSAQMKSLIALSATEPGHAEVNVYQVSDGSMDTPNTCRVTITVSKATCFPLYQIFNRIFS